MNPLSLASPVGLAQVTGELAATVDGRVLGSIAGQLAGAQVGRAVARSARRVATSAPTPRPDGALFVDPASVQRLLRASVVRGRSRAGVRGYATAPQAAAAAPSPEAKATSSAASTKSSSPLGFLSDPKLSIEEKLMRLLAYLNDKYEKDIQAKMDQIAGKAPKAGSGTSGSTGKKDGILGALGSAVSSIIGADTAQSLAGFLKLPGVKSVLGTISGPVLAAAASAAGFPAAAPLLLKYGSKIVDVAAGVVNEAASSGASPSGSSAATGSTSGSTSAAAGGTGKDDQLMMMEIQRLMEKQKEMFSLVSNVIRTLHDTRMTAINNIR